LHGFVSLDFCQLLQSSVYVFDAAILHADAVGYLAASASVTASGLTKVFCQPTHAYF
jgi:hypothetical protein